MAMSATPPASPSMLSSRLRACTTPPNQTTATNVAGSGRLLPYDAARIETVSAPTISEETLPSPSSPRRVDAVFHWLPRLVAVVWFGGVVHALNLLDNMEGLAGGMALIAIGMLSVLFAATLGSFVVIFLVSVAGSLSGFSTGTGNRRDCSWAIRAACSSADARRCVARADDHSRDGFLQSAVLVLLVLVVPLFDTGFVLVLRRLAAGKRPGAEPTTFRIDSCRSGSPSGVPFASCTCSAWRAGLMALMIQREGCSRYCPWLFSSRWL